jgi:hypothetical protein
VSDDGHLARYPCKVDTHDKASVDLVPSREDHLSGPRGWEAVGVFAQDEADVSFTQLGPHVFTEPVCVGVVEEQVFVVDDSDLLVLQQRISIHTLTCTWVDGAYRVFIAEFSRKFYGTGRCQLKDKVLAEVRHTNANGAASNDHDVFCRLETLLPLGQELTDVGVALWEVYRTSPLGSSRQREDCVTEEKLDDYRHHDG